MTWAAVITLMFLGLAWLRPDPPARRLPPANRAVDVLLGLWCLACAYALWDRYL